MDLHCYQIFRGIYRSWSSFFVCVSPLFVLWPADVAHHLGVFLCRVILKFLGGLRPLRWALLVTVYAIMSFFLNPTLGATYSTSCRVVDSPDQKNGPPSMHSAFGERKTHKPLREVLSK